MFDAADTAARAILEHLGANLESRDPHALALEIVEVLEGHERAVDALTSAIIAATTSVTTAQRELDRRSVADGVLLDEDAVPDLLVTLDELLLDSENVDEMFVDDETLTRILRAALLDYVGAVASAARAKIGAALMKPRAAIAAAAAPQPIAAAGYAFPLFEAPLALAAVDEKGPCTICKTVVDVRFAKACYACFRAGKAVAHGIGTELGTVTFADAAEGLTHGVPRRAIADGYDTVDLEGEGEGEHWVRVRIDRALLAELVRTPAYETWQGESWLFCCKAPMVFTGPIADLVRGDESDGALVAQLLGVDLAEGEKRALEASEGRISTYAFRCDQCGSRRACWDQD